MTTMMHPPVERRLKARHYDPLMTDNEMSKMTGVDLIDKLRRTCDVLPIIMAAN
jgi:CheY-like chemotaxis protein